MSPSPLWSKAWEEEAERRAGGQGFLRAELWGPTS